MAWGSNNDSASVPTFIEGMKAAGYTNNYANSTQSGVWGVVASVASGNGYMHTGWVYEKRGTGAAVSATVANNGAAYANTDTFTVSGGATAANGTLITDGDGGITGVNFNSRGSGYRLTSANSTITTSTGSGGLVTIVFGGKAGRKSFETLVAMSSMTTANAANQYTGMV